MGECIALVMAGGGGTRLWPASIASRPKQLLDPLLREVHADRAGGPHPRGLLAETIERLAGLVAPDRVFVVTTLEQVPAIRAALPDLAPDHIIAEPYGRNTAPCVALSVMHLRARLGEAADDATLLVLPADHHVSDPEGLRRLLRAASIHARQANAVLTLGIAPDRPATGFGYIQRGPKRLAASVGDDDVPVYPAVRFVEKPDVSTARRFVESGEYLWNAGIFVMPLPRIASEFERHCPVTWSALLRVQSALGGQGAEAIARATATAYEEVVPEPIDVAVMEKLADLRVIPAAVGWTDLGSWRAVYDIAERDVHGSAAMSVAGKPPVLIDAPGCLVWSEDAQVALVGVQDLAVVCSGGRVLVCPLDRTQDVRHVVVRLASRDDGTR